MFAYQIDLRAGVIALHGPLVHPFVLRLHLIVDQQRGLPKLLLSCSRQWQTIRPALGLAQDLEKASLLVL